MPHTKPVLLIFSGGLDTSFCVLHLRERGFDPIYTVTCDVGQPREDLQKAEAVARKLGCRHTTVDCRKAFAGEMILPALWAHARYGGYYLSTALARPIIARAAAEVARKHRIRVVAHGCTGKGNDQFRLEYALQALLPEAKILAPIREGNFTRSEEVRTLRRFGINFSKKPYSVDENLWGRSIEGEDLENIEKEPGNDVFTWTKLKAKKPRELTIEFLKGVPVKLNRQEMDIVSLISKLNQLAGQAGIGRVDVVEDRILGVKSREVYENPAAETLYEAHRHLESLVLTHPEQTWKEILSKPFAELLYQGLYFHPLFEAMKAFFEKMQQRMTGEIRLRLLPFRLKVISRKSPFSLYHKDLISFETKSFPQQQMGVLMRMFHCDGREAYAQKKK